MANTPVPIKEGDLLPWCISFAGKFPNADRGPALGFSTTEVTALVDDANSIAYTLGTYFPAISGTGSAAMAWKNSLKNGDPVTPAVPMPMLLAMATPPPVGATFRFGARDRLVAAVARAKKSPNYDDIIEADLNIATPGQKAQAQQPTFTGTPLGGGVNRLDWDKNGWTGVHCKMRRRGDAGWTFDLGLDLQSPLLDKTPLAVAGQPEVREYQMQYIDGDDAAGDWSDIVPVTTN